MDTLREFEEDRTEAEVDDTPGVTDPPRPNIGSDERRMHVRAYNYWVSLLKSRPYPSIADLDPANIADFGANSVLLDFTGGLDNPSIAFLGRALREECALDETISHILQVPARSLLSRLTDHYLQIIANRAPIGFEAEFVGTRNQPMMYRGILMPFSSNGEVIDYIYGVINWKELADAATQGEIVAELGAALAKPPAAPVASAPAWGDATSGSTRATTAVGGPLADQLLLARQTASAVRAAETRSRAALYRALARAHEFAAAADRDPAGLADLLAANAITVQLRAPMTPIVKLVFGPDHDKARLTEYAAVLSHARRSGIAEGELTGWLDGFTGGIKAVVQAERAARRGSTAAAVDPVDRFAGRDPLASVKLPGAAAGAPYIVLLARAGANGMVDIIATTDDPSAVAVALRRVQ